MKKAMKKQLLCEEMKKIIDPAERASDTCKAMRDIMDKLATSKEEWPSTQEEVNKALEEWKNAIENIRN